MANKVDPNQLARNLGELIGEFSEVSPVPVVGKASECETVEEIILRNRQKDEKFQATVDSIQDSLDYLRLAIKYLVFDLEATRRENDQLRAMLAEPYNPADSGDDEQPA